MPEMIDRPRVQLDVMRHAEEDVQEEHRRGSGALAAAAARQVHPQSGHDRRASTAGVFDMSRRRARYRRRQLRLGSLGGGEPVSRAARGIGSRDASISRPKKSGSIPDAMRSAPPSARFKQRLRPSALKQRKKEKYPGEWAKQLNGEFDLLVSSGGSGHRELRPVPEAEGEEHSVRGARARRAVHNLAAGRHRHSRDDPQLARREDLRAP